jgi:hypothetical protein
MDRVVTASDQIVVAQMLNGGKPAKSVINRSHHIVAKYEEIDVHQIIWCRSSIQRNENREEAQEWNWMTMITYFIAERDLHSYVDNLLDQKRRNAVEKYLTRHAVLAETVAAYRAQNIALAKFSEEGQPMPEQIRTLIRELALCLAEQPEKTDTTPTSRQAVASARR